MNGWSWTARRAVPSTAIALSTALLTIGCGDDPGALDRPAETSPSNPVAPSRAPLAIPGTGPGAGEILAGGDLDPFSLPADYHAASGPLTPSTTTLPVDETYGGSAGFAFRITQEGSGNGGWFRIRSATSSNRMALLATHTGEGIAARAINTGTGRAFWAQIPEPSNPFPSLVATHVGSGEALEAINFGSGRAASFEIRGSGNASPVLEATTDGMGDVARLFSSTSADQILNVFGGSGFDTSVDFLIDANHSGGPRGGAARFTSSSSADGVVSMSGGSGFDSFADAVLDVTNSGAAGAVARLNSSTSASSLVTIDGGQGFDGFFDAGITVFHRGSSGQAARFQTASEDGGVRIEESGTGTSAPLLQLVATTSSGDFAGFGLGGAQLIRFDRTGKGFFDGGTQTGGADIAESFDVEGPLLRYEPGDVLVISTRRDRRVERSAEPYSTRVIGVYATKPGVLLSDEDIDAPGWGRVPVGVVGVVPTRVTAENGPIGRGDLLVTSSRPGHAMRADLERVRVGQVLGKALQSFDGSGSGLIEVMVNVK